MVMVTAEVVVMVMGGDVGMMAMVRVMVGVMAMVMVTM